MTEEEKQAIQEIFNKRLQELALVADFKLTETFWDDVEAKLSPKHPSDNAICLGWDGDNDGNLMRGYVTRHFDHYREIPTAEDALKVVEVFAAARRADTPDLVDGIEMAASSIQKLIDNAATG